jgi:hypothetical protein
MSWWDREIKLWRILRLPGSRLDEDGSMDASGRRLVATINVAVRPIYSKCIHSHTNT